MDTEVSQPLAVLQDWLPFTSSGQPDWGENGGGGEETEQGLIHPRVNWWTKAAVIR